MTEKLQNTHEPTGPDRMPALSVDNGGAYKTAPSQSSKVYFGIGMIAAVVIAALAGYWSGKMEGEEIGWSKGYTAAVDNVILIADLPPVTNGTIQWKKVYLAMSGNHSIVFDEVPNE